MSNMGRMNISDLVGFTRPTPSEYVVVDCPDKSDGGFVVASTGDFLEHIGDNFYKCKRIVAVNLGLSVIANYPLSMK